MKNPFKAKDRHRTVRAAFLQSAYELAEGHTDRRLLIANVIQRLSVTHEDVDRVLNYLHDEGYIRPHLGWGHNKGLTISLTPLGIREAEAVGDSHWGRHGWFDRGIVESKEKGTWAEYPPLKWPRRLSDGWYLGSGWTMEGEQQGDAVTLASGERLEDPHCVVPLNGLCGNALVMGSVGSGKAEGFIKPLVDQMMCDPSWGGFIVDTGTSGLRDYVQKAGVKYNREVIVLSPQGPWKCDLFKGGSLVAAVSIVENGYSGRGEHSEFFKSSALKMLDGIIRLQQKTDAPPDLCKVTDWLKGEKLKEHMWNSTDELDELDAEIKMSLAEWACMPYDTRHSVGATLEGVLNNFVGMGKEMEQFYSSPSGEWMPLGQWAKDNKIVVIDMDVMTHGSTATTAIKTVLSHVMSTLRSVGMERSGNTAIILDEASLYLNQEMCRFMTVNRLLKTSVVVSLGSLTGVDDKLVQQLNDCTRTKIFGSATSSKSAKWASSMLGGREDFAAPLESPGLFGPEDFMSLTVGEAITTVFTGYTRLAPRKIKAVLAYTRDVMGPQ